MRELNYVGAIFMFGICIIIFGLSEIFWISVLAMFLSGVFDGVSVVIRNTILQLRHTPDRHARSCGFGEFYFCGLFK